MNGLMVRLTVAGWVSLISASWAASLPFGQTETGSVVSAAQTNSYTFAANAGDIVSVTMSVTSGSLSPKIQLFSSNGTVLAASAPNFCQGSTTELNTFKIPAAGTYTVVAGDCGDTNTGVYWIYAQLIDNPFHAITLPFGGPSESGTIGSAAQSDTYVFSANANDVIDFTMAAASGNLSPKIRLYNPAGALIGSAAPNFCQGASTELNTVTLAATGNYTVLIGDCSDTNTGAYGFFAQRTNNPGSAAPLILGGQIQTGTIAVAQRNTYIFEGSAGDGLNFTMTATKGGLSPRIRIYSPAGAILSANSPNFCQGSTTELNQIKIPSNGIYTVLVGDCSDTQTGNYNFSGQCFGVCPSLTPPPAVCNFALAPTSQLIPATVGTGTVGVLTTDGCPWTASSPTSFLSITSGSSGIGSGAVQFSATANTTAAARAGTLIVAGQTATVNQSGTAPLLLLTPSSLAVQWRQQSALPAAIPISVYTAVSSLSFTAAASSTGNWLSVNPASGTAPATIIASVNPSSLQPGMYQGTVTVTAPTANPSSQTFTVSLTVLAAGVPALSLTTTSLKYSFPQGSQQVQQQRILVGNSGGGTLSYTASASTNSGGNWLSVTQDAAGATPSTPDPLTISVDPSSLAAGTYTGLITIGAAGATQNIPVTVTVSAVQQTILLSQTGLTFTAVVNGGIVPPQTFGILNSGNGVMNWAVSSTTVNGGNGWLSVTPISGSTDASSLTVPLITVSVNPANLAPGQYSGQIQVVSTTSNNSPQFVSVILNVLPAGSNPGPIVLPTGLIFTEAAGGTPAGPQQVVLSNLTASQLVFTTGKLTIDGANWFSVTPATGTAAPTQATTLTVSVSSAGLSPAIRQGVLTLLFQDGSVRNVNVFYLLATGGVSSSIRSESHPLATGGSCTPTRLLPVVTSLGSQFTVPAGWPNTLATQVVDDCGNPHVNGTVTATFSNGDPPLPLVSLKNGNWTGTWQVRNSNASLIAITVNADNSTQNLAGSVSVSGSLQSSANVPVMDAGGILNAASYEVAAPLSPGMMISIFGSNLANGTASAPSLPLGMQLAGTLVTIGGKAAPLLYAGQGQINAIIPYGLPVNTNSQVIVQQGNAYTSPEPITLASAQPAFFSVSQSGTGQAIVTRPDGQLAQPGTPAHVGDVVVFYGAGLGEVTPTAVAGQAASSSPVENVVAPTTMTIGGQTATVQFAGLVPGAAGLYQVNAVVPTGASGNAIPVVLMVAGQSSPTVTMAVQ